MPVLSVLPASIIGMMLFLVHFFAIYWYKITRIPQFADTNPVDQFVHVLANTIVVVPFMTWDIQNDANSNNEPTLELMDDGECVCLRRSASADQLIQSDPGAKTTPKKGHRRSASDTMAMGNVKKAFDAAPLGPVHENICIVNSRFVVVQVLLLKAFIKDELEPIL